MKRNIPIDFILGKQKPTWEQVSLGLAEGWLEHRDVIKFAEKLVAEGDSRIEVLDVASITDVSDSFVSELTVLVEQEQKDEQLSRIYWLRVILAWVYESRNKFDDPLSIVEELYADFEYPEEIRNLVRYNEPSDGYRPQDYSVKENELRLMGLWNRYLESVFPDIVE